MIPFASSIRSYCPDAGGEFPGLGDVGVKEMARCTIGGGQRLSIPLEGGASVLKHREDPLISQHGRWQEVHLGAWKARYGRTPWFIHLYPEMERVYGDYSHGSLSQFTAAMDEIAKRWIGDTRTVRMAWEMKRARPERMVAIGEEMLKNTDPSLSIFEALFRFGRETLYMLITLGDLQGSRKEEKESPA